MSITKRRAAAQLDQICRGVKAPQPLSQNGLEWIRHLFVIRARGRRSF